MEFDDIRTFVAVVEAGSLSQAARQLFLTQPAVTRRLQRLEFSLGARLVDRRTRPFALTMTGRTVLEKCRRVLHSVQDVQSATTSEDNPTGELRIGVAHALTEITLTEPVDRLRSAFPKVSLRLSTGWSRDLLGKVRSGALDAAIILLPRAEDLVSGVRGVKIGQEQLLIVAAKRRAGKVRNVRDLNGVNWILNPEGCGARASLERALNRENVNMRVTLETYNYDLQLELVARNRGFSLVPSRIFGRSRLRARLRVLNIRNLSFPLTVWAVQSEFSTTLDPIVTELNRLLMEKLSDTCRFIQ